ALVAQVAAAQSDEPSALGDRGELRAFARLADAATRWECALAELSAATGMTEKQLGGGGDHLTSLGEHVAYLREHVASLAPWTRFHLARRAAVEAGVGPAIAAIERGDLDAADLAAAWERATLLACADAELRVSPAVARFHGAAQHAHVAAFADLDRGSLGLARA